MSETFSLCRCGVDYYAPLTSHAAFCDVWDGVTYEQAQTWEQQEREQMTKQKTETEHLRDLCAGVFFDLLEALEDTVGLEIAPVDSLAAAVQTQAGPLFRAGVIDDDDKRRANAAVEAALFLLHEWDGDKR